MNPEINIAGVYISTMVPTAIASLFGVVVLRRLLSLVRFYSIVWHPALFDAALFLVLWAAFIHVPMKG